MRLCADRLPGLFEWAFGPRNFIKNPPRRIEGEQEANIRRGFSTLSPPPPCAPAPQVSAARDTPEGSFRPCERMADGTNRRAPSASQFAALAGACRRSDGPTSRRLPSEADSSNRNSQSREICPHSCARVLATRPRVVPVLRLARFSFIFATDSRNAQDPMFTGLPAAFHSRPFVKLGWCSGLTRMLPAVGAPSAWRPAPGCERSDILAEGARDV
jgi:hypothetical protein